MSEENVSEAVESAEVSEDIQSEESGAELSQEEGSEESSEGVEVQAETTEELEEEIEQALEEGATKEEIKSMIETFELKVNGKTYQRRIDLNDKDALKQELQLALAGRQAMQRTAEIEKSYKNDLEQFKSNPKAFMERMGIDPIEFSAKAIEEHLAQNAKDPEELEREKRLSEFEELKAENERLKKDAEDKIRQAEMSKVEKEIETDILSALDSDGELPNTPEVFAMVTDTMLYAMKNGWTDVTAADVMPTVKQELQNKFRTLAGSLKSTDALKALLGDDALNKLREERVQSANKAVKNVSNIKQSSKVEKKEEVRKKRALSELFK